MSRRRSKLSWGWNYPKRAHERAKAARDELIRRRRAAQRAGPISKGPLAANDEGANSPDQLAGVITKTVTPANRERQLPDLDWFVAHPNTDYRVRDAFLDELDDETARLIQIGVTRRAALAGRITAYIQRGVLG